MNLEALGFKKSSNPRQCILEDKHGIRYNPSKDSWHIRGASRYPVAFYPVDENDILDVRRLFTKK